MPAVLHRDPRHVLFGHAVALHVAHRRHRQHVDRAERQRTFVAGIPDLVQHGLRIAAFADLVGAGGQHDVEHAGRHVVVRRRHRRNAGGTAVVDAQERLVACADGVHAEPFGVADADHRIGRQRIYHGLDRIEVEPGILHRAHDALAHEFRVAGVVAARAEFRLANADDADAVGTHGRASFAKHNCRLVLHGKSTTCVRQAAACVGHLMRTRATAYLVSDLRDPDKPCAEHRIPGQHATGQVDWNTTTARKAAIGGTCSPFLTRAQRQCLIRQQFGIRSRVRHFDDIESRGRIGNAGCLIGLSGSGSECRGCSQIAVAEEAGLGRPSHAAQPCHVPQPSLGDELR